MLCYGQIDLFFFVMIVKFDDNVNLGLSLNFEAKFLFDI